MYSEIIVSSKYLAFMFKKIFTFYFHDRVKSISLFIYMKVCNHDKKPNMKMMYHRTNIYVLHFRQIQKALFHMGK